MNTFGKLPTGKRLERIKSSANYNDGSFQNKSFTPNLAEGASFFKVTKEFLYNKDKRNRPSVTLPSEKTDLHHLDPKKDVLVWFGHSSYFMQVDGKKILVDPVFSSNASPFSFTTYSFKGSDVYTPEDMPEIDYLIITHDHYDHLDYETIIKLKSKVKRIITGLGVGAHFEQWGFEHKIITEKDWDEEEDLGDGFKILTTSGRHFSGRGFKRNQSIWLSMVLVTPTMKIFIGGDSGYDTHFELIGEQHGPFDLAILECGQYNAYWKYIHMMPEETVQAAIDLKAKVLLPVHWAKFSLSLHAWDEPITRVVAEASKMGMPILHPMIGEAINLNGNNEHKQWWLGID